MAKDAESKNISSWLDKTNWAKRPKAVCKPCWELKYCPYGPLVEDFPLKEENDEISCRIFGHDCPVFSVAEPFSETRELRNISRQIPRVTQFRVLKRENQICSECSNAVRDTDIEFDHIIPWSKGGSSDESNIRLLCSNCNRKKGNKFEEAHLVNNVSEHLTEPAIEGSIKFLIIVISVGHELASKLKREPDGIDFADELSEGELSRAETMAAEYYRDFNQFFSTPRPKEFSISQYSSLKLRWGFDDGIVYKLKEVVKRRAITLDLLFAAEHNLVQRLGLRMSKSKTVEGKWKRL